MHFLKDLFVFHFDEPTCFVLLAFGDNLLKIHGAQKLKCLYQPDSMFDLL